MIVINIYDGGASIRCAQQLQVGETATLQISGFATALPFIVRNHDGEAAHVAFTFGDELKRQLSIWRMRNFDTGAAA